MPAAFWHPCPALHSAAISPTESSRTPVEVVSSLASISSCRIAGSSRDPSIRCGTSWLYRTSALWLFGSRTMLEMLAISAGAAAPVVVSGWPCARVVWVVAACRSRFAAISLPPSKPAQIPTARSRQAATGAAHKPAILFRICWPSRSYQRSGGSASSAPSNFDRERAARLASGSITGRAPASAFSASNCSRSLPHSGHPARCRSSSCACSSASSPYAASTIRSCATSHFISTSFQPPKVPQCSSKTPPSDRDLLPQSRQLCSQLLCRSKERILGGFFRSVQHFSNHAQPQSLVVLQFKNHPLARRQLLQRGLNPLSQYLAVQLLAGVRKRPVVRNRGQQVNLPAGVIHQHRAVLAPRLAPPQLVQAKIGHNPVNPRIKRALKPEISQIPVGLQEGLLVNILCVVLTPRQAQSQPENLVLILPNQRVKGRPRPCLRLADQLHLRLARLPAPLGALPSVFCPGRLHA